MHKIEDFEIITSTEEHRIFAVCISNMISNAALNEGAALAMRTPEYLNEKIVAGKAIIAFYNKEVAGFCYIEEWSHTKFVANSGLIVKEKFQGYGLATEIKRAAFRLSQKKHPMSKIFGLTSNATVMNINSKLGYRPVVFEELTRDAEFWKGCKSCPGYDILQRMNHKRCLCTAMLFNPLEVKLTEEQLEVTRINEIKVNNVK